MADLRDLSSQIEDFVTAFQSTERDLEDCQQVVRRVETILTSKGLHGQVISYGSAATALWTRQSNLDLTVLTQAASALQSLYEGLAESVFAERIGWRQRGTQLLVVYFDSVSRILVNLTVNDELGLWMRRLLCQYISQDTRFFYLAAIVKHWAHAKLLCKPDSYFSGYVWTLLVLHFLMRIRPFVIKALQYQEHAATIKQGFDVWFDRSQKQPSPNKISIGDLLIEFFRHYSTANRVVLDMKTGTWEERKGSWITVLDPFTGDCLSRSVRVGSQQHRRLVEEFRKALEGLVAGVDLTELIS